MRPYGFIAFSSKSSTQGIFSGCPYTVADEEKTNYKTRELVSHVNYYTERELKPDFTFVLTINLLLATISFIHSSELITLIKQTANGFKFFIMR